MKFEEKLIKLRKEKALSQEELAEKLDVTRQTISKWELGQTKPDSEKIMQIAKLFNVSTDELLNDSDTIVKDIEENEEDNKKTRNTIIVVGLIAILILIVLFAGSSIILSAFNRILGLFTSNNDEYDRHINTALDIIEKGADVIKESEEETKQMYNETKQKIEESDAKFNEIYDQAKQQIDNYDKEVHNNRYQRFVGVQQKVFVETVINNAIKDNSEGVKKVTVMYKGIAYTESGELSNLISSLNKDRYLITCEYDAEGFVNVVSIADA